MTETICQSSMRRDLLEAYGCEVLTRCGDCKYWGQAFTTEEHPKGQRAGYCSLMVQHGATDPITGERHYCSYGRPRGEDD